MHQPDLVVGAAILVMGEALHERAGAIADADDGDVDRLGVVEAHLISSAMRGGAGAKLDRRRQARVKKA